MIIDDKSDTAHTKDSVYHDYDFIGSSVDSEARGEAADKYAHEQAINRLELDKKRLQNQLIEEKRGHLSEDREMRLTCSKHAIWIAWTGNTLWLLAFLCTGIYNLCHGRILFSDNALTVMTGGATLHLSVAFISIVKGLFVSNYRRPRMKRG